jgi:predicted small lipoprotein YifL
MTLLAAAVAGCGQKGPLVLPKPAAATAPSAAPVVSPPAATPAASAPAAR